MIDCTELSSRIVASVAERTPGFAHLDPARIAIAAAPRWAGVSSGNLACCIALRRSEEPTFNVWVRRGTREIVEVGRWHRVRPPEVVFGGAKASYLILLRLPRHLAFDPLETLVHELYHISEKFDGRLRAARHGKRFDAAVRRLTRDWLARAEPDLAETARMDFAALRERHGAVVARTLPASFRANLVETVEPPCSYEEAVRRLYPAHRLAPDFRVRPWRVPPAGPERITERDCSVRVYRPEGALTVVRGGRPPRPGPAMGER